MQFRKEVVPVNRMVEMLRLIFHAVLVRPPMVEIYVVFLACQLILHQNLVVQSYRNLLSFDGDKFPTQYVHALHSIYQFSLVQNWEDVLAAQMASNHLDRDVVNSVSSPDKLAYLNPFDKTVNPLHQFY